MRHIAACGAALVLSALLLPQAARGADIAKHDVSFGGRARSYYLYVPPSLPGAPAPLLVLLHGSGRDGHAIIRLWKADADRHGLVLLAPNALHLSAWRLRDDGPGFIRAAIAAVAGGYSIDARRVYLFGQSGGAVYALLLSMLESRFFAATAVHAGAWRTPLEYRALGYLKRKIPVAIVVGDRDEFFSLAAVHKTEGAMKRAGIPIAVTVIAGQHHWYDDKSAPRINPIAWDFLKARELDRPPVFSLYGTDGH